MGMGKKKEPLIYKGSCGGRNRTRTCDPIDVNDVLYQLSHATKFCYRFLCNLHIPSVKGVLQGLEARSLCNPYRMDYQLSHATLSERF